MNDKSLYEALLEYKTKDMSSFHTPGHKNNFFKNLTKFDYTELTSTDDLYNPTGAIKVMEEKATKLFGSGYSLASATGCTLCIQAMIKLFCKSNSKIICSKMVHKSAVNIMSLLNITPIWLTLKTNADNFFLSPSCEEIEYFLEKNHSDVSAVYITSPDYYGTVADVPSISKICKKYDVPLLVDNAHGAHFMFLKPNIHPLNLGADAVADSLHKTLPVLTGGALLHVKDRKYLELAKKCMSFFGSSSPSFPIMVSIDLCLNWLQDYGVSEFLKLKETVKEINILAENCGIIIPKHTHDQTRFCFNLKNIGITGKECAEHFRKHKVEVEFCTQDFVVLIPSPFNTERDFTRLKEALETMPKKINKFTFSSNNNKKKSNRAEAKWESNTQGESATSQVKNSEDNLIKNCPPGVPRSIFNNFGGI